MTLRLLWLDEPPPEDRRKKRRRLPHFLRKAEIDLLLAKADANIAAAEVGRNHKKRIVCCIAVMRACQQDRMICVLGIYLGLRVSEITGLCVEDINLIDRDVFVCGKGRVERYVPIPKRIIDEIAAWVRFRKSGLFLKSRRGRRLCTSYVNYRLRRLGKAAGLSKGLHAHVLRHTLGSRLYEETRDLMLVRDVLGHASVACSQIYVHCSPGRKQEGMDKL